VAAFNLVCIGIQAKGVGNLPPVVPKLQHPYSITYRVDLDRRLWCSGSCTTTEPIVSVTESKIILRLVHPDARGYGMVESVNPQTLEFTTLYVLAGVQTDFRSGTCERAPFTGFPSPSG
jgi:hypothetical protein